MELYLSSREEKNEKEVTVVVCNKDGTVDKCRIFPDSVRQMDNGVEETYTFKLFTREGGLL